MLFCTLATNNHLFRAFLLAKSIRKVYPKSKIVLCIVEEEVIKLSEKILSIFDEVILAKHLDFSNFYQFIFKYNVYEAVSSCKPQLLLYLLNKYKNEEIFNYLDSDIKLFGPLDEIYSINSPIILTPHRCKPLEEEKEKYYEEITTLKDGAYNAGFICVKRHEQSLQFLEWWNKRVQNYGNIDRHKGLFTDQKWLNLAPCYFDVFILKHLGYNVASWNIHERMITYNFDENQYEVDSVQLKFFHFSGLNSWLAKALTYYFPESTEPVHLIKEQYQFELHALGEARIQKIPWVYNYFQSGEKILRKSRERYRKSSELQHKYKNPFVRSNRHFI